jgi:2-C-methyl-D-erythritol 4-phosphate cytidylyltransferase
MVYVAILAAGFGVRMHRQDLPKPFLMLGSKPIIIHTLEHFYVNQNIDRIVVVVADTWRTYTEDLLKKYGTFGKDVTVIVGGASKTESIESVTINISTGYGCFDDDILVTHDAIRPFVTQRMIDETISTARSFGAANTVMTTNDTIVVSLDGVKMSEVPRKYQMYAEQTPQTFQLRKLIEVFEKAKEQNIKLSEETAIARLYISFDREMRLVNGEYSNMKIINPYDLEVANALLEERSK